MSEQTICPWCHTEIHWDEEIGPEKECPYCNNELSGYRTLNVDLAEDEVDDDEDEQLESVQSLWEDDEDQMSYVSRGGGNLAAQAVAEQLTSQQFEVPECAMCREYMIEVGEETITDATFKPTVNKLLQAPLVQAPFKLIRYVCPMCFHTETKLSQADQQRMITILAEAADHL